MSKYETENKMLLELWGKSKIEYNGCETSILSKILIISKIAGLIPVVYCLIMFDLITGNKGQSNQNTHAKPHKPQNENIEPLLNLFGIGSNSGRLYDHRDSSYYRSHAGKW